MRSHRILKWFGRVSYGMLVAVCLLVPNIVAAEDQCTTIAVVYTHNRELLDSFTCRFKVTSGIVATRDDAFSNRFKKPRVRNGTWKVERGDGIYVLECSDGPADRNKRSLNAADAEKLVGNSEQGKFLPVGCIPVIQIVSVSHNMRASYDPKLGAVNLHTEGEWTPIYTPFSMGLMGAGDEFSPRTFVLGAQRGTHSVTHVSTAILNDNVVDVVDGTILDGPLSSGKWRWYIDVNRGATPIKIQVFNGKGGLRGEAHAIEVEQASNGAWLITKSVLLSERGGVIRATTVEIEDMDLNPPHRSELQFAIRSGDRVIDVSDMRSSVISQGGDTIHVDNLPEWFERCAGRLEARVAEYEADEKFQDPSTKKSWGVFLVVILGAIAGSAAIWLWRR